MRKIVAQLIVFLIVAALAVQPQLSPSTTSVPGAAYFTQAEQELAKNPRANVLPQVQQGWAVVRAVGPADPGFVRGVSTAARLFRTLGRDLDAESVYNQAILSCDTPQLAVKRSSLRYMLVQDLLANREFVKAESILRAAIADEESSPERSPIYVAFLQNLAFVREQEGELDDAERILRSTIGLGAPNLKEVGFRGWGCGGSNCWMPVTGDPTDVLATFYQQHARLDEAERLLRDEVASTAGDRALHPNAMRRLADFLSSYQSSEEAVEIQKQILSQAEAKPGSGYGVESEKAALARYEAAAGQGEQAKEMLENNLLQAENTRGRGSPEYQMALNDLFWNRNSAGDFDAAEKLAQQQLEDAQQSDHPDRNFVISALSQLAEAKRGQGRTEEADELQKKVSEQMRQANPGRPWDLQERFGDLENMIQQEMPAGQAMAEVQNIVNSYFPFNEGELFQFRMVAQNFLGKQHKPEAVQVTEILSSLQQREGLDSDPRFAASMADWAAFYASQLEDRARARVILQNARNLILDCCGENSSKLEPIMREGSFINENPAAVIAGMQRLRDFQISVFGANSRNVEETTMQLARWSSDSGDRENAKELYRTALKINAHRTGSLGPEYVQLLDIVAMEFLNHRDSKTALELNQRALEACTGFGWAAQTRSNIERHHQQIAAAIAAKEQQVGQ